MRVQAHPDTRSAELHLGQQLAEVDSPASFVVLTPTATTIQGSVKGVLVLEPADDELITAVAVQGEGTFEWSLTGDAS